MISSVPKLPYSITEHTYAPLQLSIAPCSRRVRSLGSSSDSIGISAGFWTSRMSFVLHAPATSSTPAPHRAAHLVYFLIIGLLPLECDTERGRQTTRLRRRGVIEHLERRSRIPLDLRIALALVLRPESDVASGQCHRPRSEEH